jgi:RHS repeat-associated protein
MVPSKRWIAGDVNGDGRQDAVLIGVMNRFDVFGKLIESSTKVEIVTAISRPNREFDLVRQVPTWADDQKQFNQDSFTLGMWFAGDKNGDGKTDIIGVNDDAGEVEDGKRIPATIYSAVSHGDGTYDFDEQPVNWPVEHLKIDNWQFTVSVSLSIGPIVVAGASFLLWQDSETDLPYRWICADVTGDGKTDLVLANRENSVVKLYTAISSETGFVTTRPPQETSWEWREDEVSTDIHRFLAGDVDHDGKSDLMMVARHRADLKGHPSDKEHVAFNVALSESDGTYKTFSDDRSLAWHDDDIWFPGDANGDGLTDFMQVIHQASNKQYSYPHAALRTWLSDGSGSGFTPTDQKDTRLSWHRPFPCTAPFEWTWRPNTWLIGDPDGDGKQDFVQASVDNDYDCTHYGGQYTLKFASRRDDGDYDILGGDNAGTGGSLQQAGMDDFVPLDLNGDGKTDFLHSQGGVFCGARETGLCSTTPVGIVGYVSNMPPRSGTSTEAGWQPPKAGWRPADVNGDGRTDLVYVERLLDLIHPNLRIYTILRDTTGRLQTDQSGNLAIQHQDIESLPNNRLDWLRYITGGWLIGDANRDGRSDLLKVDYEATLEAEKRPECKLWAPPTDCKKDEKASGIHVFTFLSLGDGKWQPIHEYVAGVASEDVQQWRPMDVDGDGRTDLVHLAWGKYQRLFPRPHTEEGLIARTLLAQGDGHWTLKTAGVWKDFPHKDLATWRSMDINADGKGDLVRVDHESYSTTSADMPRVETDALLSLGGGNFTPDAEYEPIDLRLGDSRSWLGTDINADGATDLVHVASNGHALTAHSLVSTGHGGWISISRPIKQSTPTGSGRPPLWLGRDILNWRPADLNGDSRTDLVHVGRQTRPTGDRNEFLVSTLMSMGDGTWRTRGDDDVKLYQPSSRPASSLEFFDSTNWLTIDGNGDGRADLLHIDQATKQLRITSLFSEAPLDLVFRLSNGMGAETDVSYLPSSAWLLTGEASGSCGLPVGVVAQMVSAVTVREHRTQTTDAVRFSYGCARWSYTERGLLGWQDVTAEHVPATTSGGTNRPGSEIKAHYQATDECLIQPLSVETRETSTRDPDGQDRPGRLFGRSTTTYVDPLTILPYSDPPTRRPGPPYICLQKTHTDYTCNFSDRCVEHDLTFNYDSFGNLQTSTENGSALPSRTVQTQYRPAQDQSSYIVNLPSSVSIVDPANRHTPVQRRLFCYDDAEDIDPNCLSAPQAGLLTATKDWDSYTNDYDTTQYQYDLYGNLQTSIDANGHQTTSAFESRHHLFPRLICNAVHQCASLTWDFRFQQVSSSTDRNNQTTAYHYDPFGRVTSTVLPNRAVLRRKYLNFGHSLQRQRIRDEFPDASEDGILWTEQYIDGLGRTYKMIREGSSASRNSAKSIDYSDTSGRPFRQSHWSYDSMDPALTYDIFQYDALGRLISKIHPDGTALKWSYSNDAAETSVTSFDEEEHPQERRADAYGRTSRVIETNLGHQTETRYTYDALDDLTSIRDAAGNVSTFEYDSLGRMRTSHDGDRGTWNYEYDRVGNLTLQTNQLNERVQFTYDALNRQETKQPNPPNGPKTIWYYDQADPAHGAGIGRLTSVSDPTSTACNRRANDSSGRRLSEDLRYDSMGQIVSDWKCVIGKALETSSAYDQLGRQKAITYPDGESVGFDYDDAGRLARATGYADSLKYNAAGDLTTAQFHNGDLESYSYDQSRQWLTDVNVQRVDKTSKTELYQAHYDFKPNGLLRSSSSRTNKMNFAYDYDDLGRLTDVFGDFEQNFEFDSIGNMTYNSATGDYKYSSSSADGCRSESPCAGPHAVTEAGGRRYRYDATGKMISRGGLRIVWTSERQPAWLQNDDEPFPLGKRWTHFIYDAWGARVFKERPWWGPSINDVDDSSKSQFPWPLSGATRYYGSLLEYSPEGLVKYYYAGSRLIARRSKKGVYWYHQDHLGSPRIITDRKQKVAAKNDYEPYGIPIGRTKSGLGEVGFTGQRTEQESGLLHLNARYYDPSLTTFLSPNPVIPSAYSPQSLDPYKYANSSPGMVVDPSGLDGQYPSDAPLRNDYASDASLHTEANTQDASNKTRTCLSVCYRDPQLNRVVCPGCEGGDSTSTAQNAAASANAAAPAAGPAPTQTQAGGSPAELAGTFAGSFAEGAVWGALGAVASSGLIWGVAFIPVAGPFIAIGIEAALVVGAVYGTWSVGSEIVTGVSSEGAPLTTAERVGKFGGLLGGLAGGFGSSKLSLPGRTFQTYTKYNLETGKVYVGRTSGWGTAEQNVAARDSRHIILNKLLGYERNGLRITEVDASSPNYGSIRGREQLRMVEFYRSGMLGDNKINGISGLNPNYYSYIIDALEEFPDP